MIKKLSLLAFIVLGLLLPAWSQQGPVGPAAIEFLAYATTGSSLPYELRPDPTVRSNFTSPILLSFDVPPSPKSPAVFLDIWGQYALQWSGFTNRICESLVYFKITSPAIPNIEFSQAYGVPPTLNETNIAGDYSDPADRNCRFKGYTKMPLIRGSLEWWWIVDKSTGQRPPDDVAISYINTIINKGFRVEVWASGTIQGLSWIAPFAFQVMVTRIVPMNQNNQR